MSMHPDTPSSDHASPEFEAYSLLRQINAMLEMYHRSDLRNEELTVPQFMILNYANADGVPLSDISARMLCDNSNLTGIVERLISKGFVERRPAPRDRRVSLICVTPTGAEKLRRLKPHHHARVSRRMRALSLDLVHALRDLLQQLFASLQVLPHED